MSSIVLLLIGLCTIITFTRRIVKNRGSIKYNLTALFIGFILVTPIVFHLYSQFNISNSSKETSTKEIIMEEKPSENQDIKLDRDSKNIFDDVIERENFRSSDDKLKNNSVELINSYLSYFTPINLRLEDNVDSLNYHIGIAATDSDYLNRESYYNNMYNILENLYADIKDAKSYDGEIPVEYRDSHEYYSLALDHFEHAVMIIEEAFYNLKKGDPQIFAEFTDSMKLGVNNYKKSYELMPEPPK
jgi:hypothetical protein